MTVESTLSRAQYGTNGTTGPFTVPFYFLQNADLRVIYTDADGNETTLVLDTGYTVTGAGIASGGTITLATAYATGGTITILRDVDATQEVDYVETDSFPAETHERALDKLTMLIQQGLELSSRSLVFSPSDASGSTLPSAASRAGKLLAFDALGRVLMSAPADGSAASLAIDLADAANTVKGDALIGVKQPFTGAVARTQHEKNKESLYLEDFGGDPTGATDSALAIEVWWSAGYANNIPLRVGPGTFATSTGHTFTYSASKKTSITGAGCGATTFRKTGANTGSVFKFTISSGSYLEMNLLLQDFEVEAPGLSAVNGIDFDAAALVSLKRVRGKNCAIGLKAYGFLVCSLEDVDFSGNQHGMQFRRGTAGSQPYANLVVIKGRSRVNGNTGWGLDYGQGSGLIIKGFLDCESNGTAGDTGTGGVLIRDTVDDEFGTGVIDIDGLWLESNKGHSFIMQGAANAHLRMNNVTVLAQESTRAITIGAIRSATFSLVNAPSANAELVCQAEQQHYLGGVQVYTLTTTGATLLTGQVKTNSSMGNAWEATSARIGALEVSTSLQGTVDGAVNLGSGSRRFNTVYATTGTINTSDEREKEQFRAQLAAERRVALAIKGSLKAFKFRDAVSEKGGAARWHFGTGAQTVASAFQAEGLDPHAYGLFCYDEWPASDDQPAGHRYGIRYDELAMFILAAI